MGQKKVNYFRILTNNWSKGNKEFLEISNMEITRLDKIKSRTSEKTPYPFLKWAGGKRQLIPQLVEFFPSKFNNYIEPFVGGGAIFFHLYKENLIKNKAILIDNNKDLINVNKVIKNNVSELIKYLKSHKNEKKYYYYVRGLDRKQESYDTLSDTEKASRIIYLNKCCYNGLYRVNSKGQFNVPFGSYKNPNFCDEKNLKAVHRTLQQVTIIHSSFEKCIDYANKGDFIYFDPPYHPLSITSSFTSYTKENFGIDSQKKLFEVFKKLDNRGCKLMLSNSYSDFVVDLYDNYRKIIITAKRAINSDATKRGLIKEILILNDFD